MEDPLKLQLDIDPMMDEVQKIKAITERLRELTKVHNLTIVMGTAPAGMHGKFYAYDHGFGEPHFDNPIVMVDHLHMIHPIDSRMEEWASCDLLKLQDVEVKSSKLDGRWKDSDEPIDYTFVNPPKQKKFRPFLDKRAINRKKRKSKK